MIWYTDRVACLIVYRRLNYRVRTDPHRLPASRGTCKKYQKRQMRHRCKAAIFNSGAMCFYTHCFALQQQFSHKGENTNCESTVTENINRCPLKRQTTYLRFVILVPKIGRWSGDSHVLPKRHIASILLINCHHKKDKIAIICGK